MIEALEANVILPLENADVSQELGPASRNAACCSPARRNGQDDDRPGARPSPKSKFFLLDGTVISGTPDFFRACTRIFEAAKQNAPCRHLHRRQRRHLRERQDAGLYRYLLTMLDGLESKSAGRICLMMTAMDVGNLPPALVRSGRIELWLETRLPADEARAAILRDLCAELPAALGDVDVGALAAATEGLVRRRSQARRRRRQAPVRLRAREEAADAARHDVLPAAVETVRRNKEHYAEAEARARARHPQRPAFFDPMSALATLAMNAEAAADFQLGPGATISTVFRET